MAEKKIHPLLKLALELGPVVGYFIAYSRLKDETFVFFGTEYSGFITVTALFIPVLFASTGVLWALTGKLSRMQLVTLVLVLVFGGLSVWLNDERFFKIKPTIVYALFAAILGFGLMRGQSYLRVVLDEALPMRPEGWMILTRRAAGFFALMALANEIVWRTMSTETWVTIETFGFPVALFAFFMSQNGVITRHAVTEAQPQDPPA